jgi:DHA1 family inner membrane transport protein
MSSRINLPLLALAIGAFAIGTTEFSPMGLLPNIANDLGVSIPSAGMLITGYALGVMLGAPIMTLWFGGFARRNALILLMAIFTIGNLIAAFSPNYMSLMGARLLTSLNHGALGLVLWWLPVLFQQINRPVRLPPCLWVSPSPILVAYHWQHG